jgi:ectoine hydroxylase-related dioxygenase (phytanoyl-CoA dioxygenase family)
MSADPGRLRDHSHTGTAAFEQQAAFFHTFGALRVRGLFAAEIETLSQGFDEVFRDHEPEIPDPRISLHRVASPEHGPPRRQIPATAAIRAAGAQGFIERSPKLAWLRDDPRIADLAHALLGNRGVYTGSVGNVFNSYIYWHSDYFRGAVPQDTRLKFAFYLDALDANCGALRVMPGTSHLGPYRDALYDEARDVKPGGLEHIFGVPEDELPCWAIDSEPGDVIVFNNTTLHANFNGGPNRRMFSLQFSQVTSVEL